MILRRSVQVLRRLIAVVVSLAAGFAACSDGDLPPEPTPELIAGRFVNATASNLPVNDLKGKCMDATNGDVDGDGDLDLVLAQENATNLVLLNDGNAVFAIGMLDGGDGDNEDVRLVDLDGDGDLDLVTVHEDDQQHYVLENDGVGGFVEADGWLPDGLRSTANALEVYDLDGDGLDELLLGNAGQNLILSRAGDGTFVDRSAERPIGDGTTQDLLFVDVDGDGDDDLFVVNEEENRLFINRGDGSFADETAERLPSVSSESREADAADIDGDGDLDIVVANVRFNRDEAPTNRLLVNDGSGVFADVTDTAVVGPANEDSSFTVRFFDFDGDGDADVLSPINDLGDGGSIELWENRGDGSFVAPAASPFDDAPEGSTFDVEVVDLNGDGAIDVYFCNRSGNDQLYLGG